MRELQSYIGTRPANVDALLRGQTPARDLRLEPQLYNWLAFGFSPGSPAPHFPLKGGTADNSDDHQSTKG